MLPDGKWTWDEFQGAIDLSDSSLDESEKSALLKTLFEYRDVFSRTDDDIGTCMAVHHSIQTGHNGPTHAHPYRVPYSQRDLIRNEVERMVNMDVAEPSGSSWASPVVLVQKKDKTWRFCVDYRALNAITERDRYPFPRVDDLLNEVSGARYLSTADLTCGYWQLPIAEADRPKTAFTTFMGCTSSRSYRSGYAMPPPPFNEQSILY